jgi:hypothetical protein
MTGVAEIDDTFNAINKDRLAVPFVSEENSDEIILSETGGIVMHEEQGTDPEVGDLRFGDQEFLKKEFKSILSFDQNDPFADTK